MFRACVAMLFVCCLTIAVPVPARGQPAASNAKDRVEEKIKPLHDLYGDPLPPGAIARLGTLRFRTGNQVCAVAYSPDGRLLAASGYDRSVRVWHTATGKEAFRIQLKTAEKHSRTDIEFAPDGKTIALTGDAEEGIVLWDVSKGKRRSALKVPDGETPTNLAFSPDGKSLAAVYCQRKARTWLRHLRLWRIDTGKEVEAFQTPPHNWYSFAWSGDGKTLVVGRDNEVCVCDANTGRSLRVLRRYKGFYAVMAFSGDGTIAAATTDEKVIRLWDVATGQEKHVLRGHANAISTLLFSHDGKQLISTNSTENSLRVWDVATGKLLHNHPNGSLGDRCLALSPDGKTMALGSNLFAVSQYDIKTGKEIPVAPGHLSSVRFVAFTPEGQVITHDWGNVYRWNATTGKNLGCLSERKPPLQYFAFSADGRRMAGAGWEGSLWLKEFGSGEEKELSGPQAGSNIVHLVFSPDEKILATGHNQNPKQGVCTIVLWDVGTGKRLHHFEFAGRDMFSLAFSPNGKQLATLGTTLSLFDTATGKERGQFPGVRGTGPAHDALCFSPDGSLLVCGSGVLMIWDVAKRNCIARISGWTPRQVSFSPDGRLFAVGRTDGSVEVLEELTWSLIGRRQGPSRVFAVAFSPDGRLLCSGHEDSTALVWDVASLWSPAPELAASSVDALWKQLGSGDAGEAFRALAHLKRKPQESLTLCRKHLQPVRAQKLVDARQLIADLDADAFTVREKATKALERRGSAVIPAVREALEGDVSPETRRRLQTILDQSSKRFPHELLTPEDRRAMRAIALLESIHTPEARKVLETLERSAKSCSGLSSSLLH
jgi:WD40 repeat protein